MKVHQLFSGHTTREKFEKAIIVGLIGFVFEENSDREIIRLSCGKRKTGVFEFLTLVLSSS